MKIYLDENAQKRRVAIEEFMTHLALHDCNFGNTPYEFLEGECIYIENCEELLGTQILHAICRIVNE